MYDNIKLKQRKQRISWEPKPDPNLRIKADSIQQSEQKSETAQNAITSSVIDEGNKLQKRSKKSVTQRHLMTGLVLKLTRIEDLTKSVKINQEIKDKQTAKKSSDNESIGQRIPVLKLNRLDASQIKILTKESTSITSTSNKSMGKSFCTSKQQQHLATNANHISSPLRENNLDTSYTSCDKTFNIKINLPKCTACGEYFSNLDLLQKHVKSHKPLEQNTKSVAEKRQLSGKKLLNHRHLKTHQPSKQLQCPNCEKLFTNKYNLRKHINFFHSAFRQRFMKNCSVCGKGFTDTYHMKLHLETHKPIEERTKFQCQFCEKTFLRSNYLYIHMVRHHPTSYFESRKLAEKRKPFNCHKLKKNLNSHIEARHSMVNKTKSVCKNKTQHSKQPLKKSSGTLVNSPIKAQHSMLIKKPKLNRKKQTQSLKRPLNSNKSKAKRGKFQCPDCEKFFTFKGTLKMHIRVQHPTSDQPVTECEVCGKQFWYANTLKQHMESHKPPKFQCPHCEKRCTYKGNLKTHIRQCHSTLNAQVKNSELPEI